MDEQTIRSALTREARADLAQVLAMLFGPLPTDVQQQIAAQDDLDQLNRLILVAANSASLEGFRQELGLGEVNFRILSPAFQPRG